jgi:hypothetical protein
MVRNKVKLSSIVSSQIPLFARETYPLFEELLEAYFDYLESPGNPADILTNIETYTKLDFVSNWNDRTELTEVLSVYDNEISVESTSGFPKENGLLKIGDEIIFYATKTATTFQDCTRGFSGVTDYNDPENPDHLIFESSFAQEFAEGVDVINLNCILLDEFLSKLKVQFSPGFENIELNPKLDQSLFIKQVKDFYESKGTDNSFEVLFKALYATSAKIFRPRDFLLTPSIADYRKTLDLVVEQIIGDPLQIVNRVLYQDQDGTIPKAYGTVTDCKAIVKGNSLYYKVSLDYGYNKDLGFTGSVFGNFTIHHQTPTLSKVAIGASVITVDSTIGFPDSGELLVTFSGDFLDDDSFMLVKYGSKNANQFLDVSGVENEIDEQAFLQVNAYIYSYDNEGEEVRMRVCGVLSELVEEVDTPYSVVGDPVRVWELGKKAESPQANSWVFNHAISNRVETLIDEGNLNYSIITYDNCYVNSGDIVTLTCDVGNFDGSVEVIEKEFQVSSGPTPNNSFRIVNDRPIVQAYYVKRTITKVTGSEIIANVQNTYVDNKDDVYVTSNSLPNYNNESLNLKYRSVILSGTFNEVETIVVKNHGFYTGDAVYYDDTYTDNNSLDLSAIYFVYRIDDDTFKLSRSRNNLESEKYVTLKGTTSFSKLVRLEYADELGKEKKLLPQKLVKKITTDPQARIFEYPIDPEERIGIFRNGVEILTYKSKDFCYYGGIEEVIVNSGGESYDVINPPKLEVFDVNGSGFSGDVVVSGSLLKIDVLDGGFDFIENKPTVLIKGGNPTKQASVGVNVKYVRHKVFFRSDISGVNIAESTITFANPHKFRDADRVSYSSQGQQIIATLSEGSFYYVGVIGSKKISLHKTIEDALGLINPITLSYGVGEHTLESSSSKTIIQSLVVGDGGEGYSNNKVIVTSAGINTSNYTITSKNHQFKNSDRIVYSCTGSPISGLSTTKTYIASIINKDSFVLYEENTTPGENPLKFKNNNEITELNSAPAGYHTFSYPPITVEIIGEKGVGKLVQSDCIPILNPVFRGEIKKVEVKTLGSNYGSNQILNYEKQPRYYFRTGNSAIVEPVVFNGSIKDVVIKSQGENYYSTPNVYVFESDPSVRPINATLSPVISNGKLTSIKVIDGGFNHSQNVKIIVESPGTGASLQFKLKSWNVNIVDRLIRENNIPLDDGIIVRSKNSNYGLQYTHAYAPRKLRDMVYSQKFEEGILKYQTDLESDLSTPYHSPIIGWAYDGNPIYGPYGYDTPSGGRIRQMLSGYVRVDSGNRPEFPLGFFVEDYVYRGSGDLDEYNGRYCITPEYPNGTYAYFLTVDTTIQKEGIFSQNKIPVFPYVIGYSHYSEPVRFNFSTEFDQNTFDFEDFKCRRNTKPYNLKEWYSGYDYIVQPNKIDAHYSVVKSITPGTIDSIEILDAGTGYKVKDPVLFDNVGTGGTGVSAIVSEIQGKPITSLLTDEIYINGVKLFQSNSSTGFIAVCNEPHGLLTNEVIAITGISTSKNYAIDSKEKIRIPATNYILGKDIGNPTVTGITTYLTIATGVLYSPLIDENDIIQIRNEQMKVLNVDLKSSRIRVLRNYNSTTGTAYSASESFSVLPRKFFIDGYLVNDLNVGRYDKQYYFDPAESVGIGSTHGPGITTSLYFSNPGLGNTTTVVFTRSIYLENHQLETGDLVRYNTNGGNPLVVSVTGIGTTVIYDNSDLYVVKFSKDTIGLSTVKLGITSTFDGFEYVGITTTVGANPLYFVGLGTGNYHSLKTNYDHISSEIFQSTVTVYTSQDNQLQIGDRVRLEVIPSATKTFKVYYNDKNRRLLIDRLQISSVDITYNQITIPDHGLVDGDKIIYVSENPIGGLITDTIYYVVYINKDKIELSTTFTQSQLADGERINLTSSGGTGYIHRVNPLLISERNDSIVFDLSDSSLSYVDGTTRLSAFDFKLYTDSKLRQEYITNELSPQFSVISSGRIGVDLTASVTIKVDEFTPSQLYYALVPKKTQGLSAVKSQIIIDSYNITQANKITLVYPRINASIHNTVSTSSTAFTFKTPVNLTNVSYASTNSSLNYYTNSQNTTGPISEVNLLDSGSGYKTLVGIATVISKTGVDARIKPKGPNIGTKKEFHIEDVGWDYPTDPTLFPTAKMPDVFEVDQLFSFDTIVPKSPGLNYTVFPNLIVQDSNTLEILNDLILDYSNNKVEIVKNTSSLTNKNPNFIPINNSNGFSIKNLAFNTTTKEVTLTFKTSFSDPDRFPFVVGDEILIEGCASKTLGSKGRSFNSSDFSYKLFTITEIDANIGGSNATLKYSLLGIVDADETLGLYDEVSATGIVVLKKHFPTFTSTIKKGRYNSGELIYGLTSGAIGEVHTWDANNEIIKSFGPYDFSVGELIRGEKTGTVSRISKIYKSEMYYKVGPAAEVQKGWLNEKGFLNNNLQIVQDSFYWQKFSYAIQSNISENVWEQSVESLNHLAGWKRFSDHTIESNTLSFTGISTSQEGGDFLSIADISETIDLNCSFDFDIVLDETSLIGSRRVSTGLVFNSRDFQDYEKSIGNRVLVIDDISDAFNNTPRPDPYSVISTFKLADVRSRKFLVYARDKRFTAERQVYIVTAIHNGSNYYINQYGRVESVGALGSFDIDIREDECRLLFYPNKFRVNDYDLSFITYDVKDYVSGVGNTNFGNIVNIQSIFTNRTSGIGATTIASIPLDYRTSKLLVQIEDSENIFEYDEITVLHDGTSVEIIDYGQLTTGVGASLGIGTYYAYISGSNLKIDLIPDSPYDADINVLRVSIASSESGFVDTGARDLNTTRLESHYVSIAATNSTNPTKIAEFENGLLNYSGGYLLISIEDTTNQRYQVSEMNVITDDSEAYYAEFGILFNDSEIGIITAGVNGSNTEIYFTADSSADLEIRCFGNYLGLVDTFNPNNEVLMGNARLFTGYGEYEGTERSIKREFELYHKGNPIFEKQFNGENSSIVKISDNLIELPQHFFVTGEKVIYSYGLLNEPIGIATTTVPGIGSTDKLPSELYIIKEDDLNVRFAASTEDALRLVPIPLTITTVGFGSAHYITAQKQNVKALITIDNMIQSPIVSTAVTSGLSTSVLTTDDIITLTNNVEFFFSGDLIKINDEIMKVSIVGYGGSANNIYVQRPWMGTTLAVHDQFALITKVVGNYNISRNTISFAAPPYGKYPIGLPENRPDSRDYTGITTHSTFSGRTFIRSGITDSVIEPYTKNVVFDGIQDSFTGFTSSFTLTVDGSDVTGIVDSNAIITVKDIFQSPRVLGNVVSIAGNYFLEEDEILGKTQILFEDNEYSGNDVLTRGLPTGGRIVSVASTRGFGYQPLVSAAGTAIVSSAGTISSINITNVGSGYRSGIQTVYVGLQTASTDSTGITTHIGLASISNGRVQSVSIINPGSGYTHSNPPLVVFDSPLSYSNIELEYAPTSIGRTTGVKARVDVVVGQGSSVIDFNFTNIGHGYEINNVLTVSVGGTTGIPREYRGRFIDGGNLIAVNKEYIKNETIGFVTTTYPSILSNPDYDETVCKRDIGYIVDAIAKDLAFGGNYYSVQSGLSYWNAGTSYVSGESTETISAYEYIAGISSYIVNNITVPTSYQPTISSVTQVKDLSIDYDESCNPSTYSSNCCSDVVSAISNYVGIITTIIGLGTAYTPTVQSPYSQPTLSLPTTQYFENFEITVTKTDTDEFTGWTIGDLQVIDDISNLFDGVTTRFPIKFDGIRKSIKASTGSLIDVQSTLLIFINDILQVPGQGYTFKGGSVIRFSEPPNSGDKCKIIFYKGTGSIDVEEVDILETVKSGDIVTVHSDIPIQDQDDRSVKDITSTDSVDTFLYGGRGISADPFLDRPVNWCKQSTDIIVDGIAITKDRDLYEAQINPLTNIIYDVGTASTTIYVESVKTFFDNKKENTTDKYISTVDIVTQDETRECLAVAAVNSSGIVTAISIIDSGLGYNTTPTVSISNPIGSGSTALATAIVSGGKVTFIGIDDGGSGYSNSSPPIVLVSPPNPSGEVAYKVDYTGDFGLITGIGTTTVGLSSVGLVFEFTIPENSPLKDASIVQEQITYSGISTGDFFIIKETNIGYGITSLELDGSPLVTGTEYINNVYQVHDLITDIPYTVLVDDFIASLTRYGSFSVGLGRSTTVAIGATLIIEDHTKVVTVVEDLNNIGITSFLTRSFFGEYSYGKLTNVTRPYPEEYLIYRNNGLLGISTSAIVRRTNSLKYRNYLS